MKIGITTTDGKAYVLAKRYVSVESAMRDMRNVYASASLMGIDHFACLLCEDGTYIFVGKIVSVFELKS